MGIRCADHVTPLYPQKLALTSPTGGGRSVGIVRSRTKATEFSLVVFRQAQHSNATHTQNTVPHVTVRQNHHWTPLTQRYYETCTLAT